MQVQDAKSGAQTALTPLNGKLSRKLQSDFRESSTIHVRDPLLNTALDQRHTATTFLIISAAISIHYVQQYIATTTALVPTVIIVYWAITNTPQEG